MGLLRYIDRLILNTMIFSRLHCLLAAAGEQTEVVPNPTAVKIESIVPIVIMIVLMWVILFVPQRKKAKELETLVKSLKAGDKVVTNSGIVGVVLSIKERTVAIRSAESKLEILKSAVTEVTDRSGEAEVKS